MARMPEYTYVDTRLLWLLMFLSTGFMQYVLIGAVKLVMQWTRTREEARRSGIMRAKTLTLDEYRSKVSRG